ncbi:cysteine peptidase family C39 domain-containing protein, partial [Pedobacter sp. N36a]|uniref:cysteine peptidase family C39 domain-containing protein n=1 Tax=Pedobacter sp. N36a TaxID=2767996 RepID=UPI002103DD42
MDISHAAESLGFRTISIKCTLDDLLNRIPLPAIFHWDNSHFIVVYKTSSSRFSIFKQSKENKFAKKPVYNGSLNVADPAKGQITYSSKEFASKWLKDNTDKGALLVLEPQADFYERQSQDKVSKKKTFSNFINYFRPYSKSFLNLFFVMLIITILQAL